MGITRRLTAAVATAAALTAVGVATNAPAASAAERHTVCASDLYVREQPQGRAIGTLYNGQTFDVERYDDSAQWAYGMAYGNVNAHGWVQNGWFC